MPVPAGSLHAHTSITKPSRDGAVVSRSELQILGGVSVRRGTAGAQRKAAVAERECGWVVNPMEVSCQAGAAAVAAIVVAVQGAYS